jgi:hypothetical protein
MRCVSLISSPGAFVDNDDGRVGGALSGAVFVALAFPRHGGSATAGEAAGPEAAITAL